MAHSTECCSLGEGVLVLDFSVLLKNNCHTLLYKFKVYSTWFYWFGLSGQRSLAGHSLRGLKELDTTQQLIWTELNLDGTGSVAGRMMYVDGHLLPVSTLYMECLCTSLPCSASFHFYVLGLGLVGLPWACVNWQSAEYLGKIQGRDAVHFFQLLFWVWAVGCDPSGSLLSKLFMFREGTDL